MIRTFVETEHVKFEFRLTPGGGRVNTYWSWHVISDFQPLKVTGWLSKSKQPPDDVEIAWMELPEGADFDRICDLIESTVRTEYAAIVERRAEIIKELKERFNASRQA